MDNVVNVKYLLYYNLCGIFVYNLKNNVMKTTLIIAMVLISLTGKAQGLIYNSIGFEYTPFIQAVCAELEINADIYIITTDEPVNGFVTKNGFGGYIIFVNNNHDEWIRVKSIITHELLHIKDDLEGAWDISEPTSIIKRGQVYYTSDEARQIEKRILSETPKIVRKFRKL